MKAQVTLFMVIGLILLVAFALTLYIVSFKSVKESSGVPEQVFKRNVVESVRSYINDCVASSAAEALDLLGKQGGRLYLSQGGIVKKPSDVINYKGFDVSYSILPPVDKVGPYSSVVPEYPWTGFPWIMQDDKEVEWFYGYFGLPEFPPLYDFSPDSVQQMLEKYIADKLPVCLSSFDFKGFSFEPGIPAVEMIIARNLSQLHTEEFVSFAVDWPVIVIDADGSRTEINDFVANYPVRLGRDYYHAKSLIDSDVSNILFNPEDYTGFDVRVIRDVRDSDDIIIFTDKQSKVIGKPFSLYIGRKNRAPALVRINDSAFEDEFCIGSRFFIYGNRLKASGGQLDYVLKAFDPDEDGVSFSLVPESPQLLGSSMSFRVVARDDGGLEDFQEIRVFGETCD